MRVRLFLTRRVHARAVVLDKRARGSEAPIRLQGQRGHAAAGVVGHEHALSGVIDHEVAGARAADGLLVAAAPLFTGVHRARIAELAITSRRPAIYGYRQTVDVGGLMSYGPHYPDLLRRAGTYVDKILKGAKPADLPVEQPTKFELMISLRTAKALGDTIPP